MTSPEPKTGLTPEDIAKVVNAALSQYDGELREWDDLDELDQQLLVHGVRVVQEGNDVKELYRQTQAAKAGDANLDTAVEWSRLKPLERRRWYLFAAIVESFNLDREFFRRLVGRNQFRQNNRAVVVGDGRQALRYGRVQAFHRGLHER